MKIENLISIVYLTSGNAQHKDQLLRLVVTTLEEIYKSVNFIEKTVEDTNHYLVNEKVCDVSENLNLKNSFENSFNVSKNESHVYDSFITIRDEISKLKEHVDLNQFEITKILENFK